MILQTVFRLDEIHHGTTNWTFPGPVVPDCTFHGIETTGTVEDTTIPSPWVREVVHPSRAFRTVQNNTLGIPSRASP